MGNPELPSEEIIDLTDRGLAAYFAGDSESGQVFAGLLAGALAEIEEDKSNLLEGDN